MINSTSTNSQDSFKLLCNTGLLHLYHLPSRGLVFLSVEYSESEFSQSDPRQAECGALITPIYRDLFHAD